MTKGAVASSVCFLTAAALLSTAGWRGYAIVKPAVLWNSVQARSAESRLRFKHDGEGLLVYYLSSQLIYSAGGQQVRTEATSGFETRRFSKARAAAEKISAASSIRAYWNPSNPKEARFDLAYGDLLAPEIAGSALAGLLLLLTGLWLRNNWRHAPVCTRCKMTIKRYYRFCPHCKTELQNSPATAN